MSHYVTTNVRLPADQIKQLKLLAIEEQKSMGQVLREILDRVLGVSIKEKGKSASKVLEKSNPFAQIAALGASGIEDAASNHDKYIYGKSKNQWKK